MNDIILLAESPGLWDFFWTMWNWINSHPVNVISMAVTAFAAVLLWRWSRGIASGGPRGLLVGVLTIVVFLVSFQVAKYALNIFPTESTGFTNSIVDGINKMPDPVLLGTPVPDTGPPDDQPPATQPPPGTFPKGRYEIGLPASEGTTCTLRSGSTKNDPEIGQIPNGTIVKIDEWVPSNSYLGCALRGHVTPGDTILEGWIHCSCVNGRYIGP
jgi:hypothetical protein